jgi:hypothetical protein
MKSRTKSRMERRMINGRESHKQKMIQSLEECLGLEDLEGPVHAEGLLLPRADVRHQLHVDGPQQRLQHLTHGGGQSLLLPTIQPVEEPLLLQRRSLKSLTLQPGEELLLLQHRSLQSLTLQPGEELPLLQRGSLQTAPGDELLLRQQERLLLKLLRHADVPHHLHQKTHPPGEGQWPPLPTPAGGDPQETSAGSGMVAKPILVVVGMVTQTKPNSNRIMVERCHRKRAMVIQERQP